MKTKVKIDDFLNSHQQTLINSGIGYKHYYVENSNYDAMFRGDRQECIDYVLKYQDQYPSLQVRAFVALFQKGIDE